MQTVKKIMSPNVEVVSPTTTLSEIANRMKSLDTGFIPVCDGKRLQGTITDRDIVIRCLAENRDPKQTRASDIMTHDVLYCYEDQSVTEAAELMQKKQVRRIVVVDRNKNLAGVVSLGDIATGTGKNKLSGQTLEDVSSKDRFSTQFKGGSIGQTVGIVALGSSVAALSYFALKRRPEIKEQLKKVIPLNREKLEKAAKPISEALET
jgi:CBS domain-containing protein